MSGYDPSMDPRFRSNQGVAFQSDLTRINTGGGGMQKIFDVGEDKVDGLGRMETEEQRLIQKVFALVDKDMSGKIDMQELQEMFKMFGLETRDLTMAISRVMQKVDGDYDGGISPKEFEKLLSEKLSSNDSESEKRKVFQKMKRSQGAMLTIDDMSYCASQLGEPLSREELMDMVVRCSEAGQQYKRDLEKYKEKKISREPTPPDGLTFEDFVRMMDRDLS